MAFRRFQGGYKFGTFCCQPKSRLVQAGIPRKVIIPLKQGFGGEVKPLVKTGDKVFAGQIIARDDNSVSSPIHATVNGRVTSIEKRNYFMQEITVALIEGDGTADFRMLEGYSADWGSLSLEKTEELLYLSGVTSLDSEGIPTRFKSSAIFPNEVEDVIIHAADSEPYNMSLKALLLGKNKDHLLAGIRILKKIMPDAKFHLVLNQSGRNIVDWARQAAVEYDWIKVYPVEPRYPQDMPEVLTPSILGREFPYGYSAATLGIVTLTIQTLLSVYEAVAEGRPLIERVIALSGPSWKENLHIKARVGSPLEFIVGDRLKSEGAAKDRLVLNSIMTGHNLNDSSLPIDRTCYQIVGIPENRARELFVFMRPGLNTDSYSRTFLSNWLLWMKKRVDTNMHGEERPCISCGWCEGVCPVGIIPHLLYRQIAALPVNESFMRYGIFNCIDCNLCSYVCPSKISVARSIKDGKQKLVSIGCDKSQCILPKFDLKGAEEYRGVKSIR
ncbi:MAG: hypothetical protein AUJ75_01105 [Candidatus Omnitrophica bacterium CG1_02_49_10]|nr:MAG: hypothetical protein AUJ75_01105 [Candidatus Omnitrophica bacterium CG1_02_49_10]